MLAPWLELDGARELLAAWSERARLDLERLGTVAGAEEIKDTAVTQPLVVALSLLANRELASRLARAGCLELPPDTVVAGHSVGELAAAAIAGVLDPDDAVALAATRGAAMAAACALAPTGMSAVLGGDRDEVLAGLAERKLVAANQNGAGQIVAAGLLPALAELADHPPAGARVKPLPVAGAFHTQYMAPAQAALAAATERIAAADPRLALLSNADGQQLHGGAEVLRRLVAQVSAPVRWDACLAELHRRGVTVAVELPPAGALTGLVKRELKGTRALAVKKPQDLDAVVELVAQPARAGA